MKTLLIIEMQLIVTEGDKKNPLGRYAPGTQYPDLGQYSDEKDMTHTMSHRALQLSKTAHRTGSEADHKKAMKAHTDAHETHYQFARTARRHLSNRLGDKHLIIATQHAKQAQAHAKHIYT